MEIVLTVLTQVIIMFLLMLVGFFSFRKGLLDEHTEQKLTSLLLTVVTPAAILHAFFMEYDAAKLKNLGIAFLLGITSHFIAIGISCLLIRKKNNPHYTVMRFAAVYSNCGFMALPLCAAVFGDEGIFYGSAYMIVFQFFSWSHGYLQLSGKIDRKKLLKTLYSPAILAAVAGLILFLTRLRLPEAITQTVSYLAALNTPLAMIVVGCSLAQNPLKAAFTSGKHYHAVFLRNLLIPACAAALYSLIPALDEKLVLINILSTACPCAALLVMFSKQFGMDTAAPSGILTLSNAAAIITIPTVIFFTQRLLQIF